MSNLFQIVRVLANIVFRPIFWVRYKGLNNFFDTGRVILCSNHISVLDPVFLMMPLQKRKIRFMGKSELFDNKLFAAFLHWAGTFPVHRDSADTGSLRTAIEILENEEPLGIFPQGGCVYEPVPFKPKAGAALLAAKAHAPILPVAISCKGRVRPFKLVEVRFGEPIPYEELGFSEGTLKEARQASRLIAERINLIMGERE